MKVLGWLALVAVIVQGVLGGTRVTQVSTFLAAVHGCTGQAFFGLMVALCVLTGRDWLSGRSPVPDRHHFRRRSLVMLGLVYVQIILGAWLRHFGTLPALTAHGLVALAVLVHCGGSLHPDLAKPGRRAGSGFRRALDGALPPSSRSPWASGRSFTCCRSVACPVRSTFYEAVVRTGHQTFAAALARPRA